MRRFGSGVALAALAALAATLLACGQPHGAGVLVVTTELPFQDSLRGDQALQMGLARFVWMWFVGGRLIVPSAVTARRPDVEPGLADRVDVSDGGRVYTIHLAPEARFASGTPVRAADVVASISPLVPPYIQAASLEVRALDERTVELRLARPQASFYLRLGWIRVGRADQMPHGAGPWVLPLASLDAAGPFRVAAVRDGEIVLAANDRARPRVRLAGVVLRVTGGGWQELAQLLDGSADMFTTLPETVTDTVLAPIPGLQPVFEDPDLEGLVLNCADPRLADRSVRRALNLAVDRRALIRRHALASARPAGGYVGDGRYDPAEAARLLDAAGWLRADGGVRARAGERFDFEVLVPTPMKAGVVHLPDALRGDLAELGVDLRTRVLDVAEMKRRAVAGQFEMILWWHQGGLAALDAYVDPGEGGFGAGDWGRCRDAAMQAAMGDAAAATDADARAAAVARFDAAASEAYPLLFVYWQLPRTFIARRFEPPPPGYALYGSLHLLGVPSDRQLPRDDLRFWLR
jgi:peptide/nickel transport system substrate-binding protein